jgi:hypothetical protein
MANSIYEQAVQNIAARAGQDTDQDLITYNRLKPYHFKALQNKYGFEDVRRYIVMMESKKKGIKTLPEIFGE